MGVRSYYAKNYLTADFIILKTLHLTNKGTAQFSYGNLCEMKRNKGLSIKFQLKDLYYNGSDHTHYNGVTTSLTTPAAASKP